MSRRRRSTTKRAYLEATSQPIQFGPKLGLRLVSVAYRSQWRQHFRGHLVAPPLVNPYIPLPYQTML